MQGSFLFYTITGNHEGNQKREIGFTLVLFRKNTSSLIGGDKMELLTICTNAKDAVELVLPIIENKHCTKRKLKGEDSYSYEFDSCKINQIGIIGPSGNVELHWYFVYMK